MKRRLLFVDDEEVIRITLSAILSHHGFEVSVAGTVGEALQQITSEKFDVLISDLNMVSPGDGLTVVSAMRGTQPDAVTIILTAYPAFETALEAIRQQVDDYIVKPAEIPVLVNIIENKLQARSQQRQQPPPKRVAVLLQEHLKQIEERWLSACANNRILAQLPVNGKRLEWVHNVLGQVVRPAMDNTEGGPPKYEDQSNPADWESFTPTMILADFCILRRALAQVIQENLHAVSLSYVIPDLARVNESLDEQAQAAIAECLKE